MRWLLIILTGLAFLLSACGKTGSGEKIAVVNWDKVLQAHPQYETLHKKQEEYNLLLDRRKEHELIGKTQMSGLARLQQLKQNSKQNYLSADFMTRMTERQTAEQEKLKQLSSQIADQVDKELAEEEKQMNEHYRLQIFNLRLKLDTVRIIPEQGAGDAVDLIVVGLGGEHHRHQQLPHRTEAQGRTGAAVGLLDAGQYLVLLFFRQLFHTCNFNPEGRLLQVGQARRAGPRHML